MKRIILIAFLYLVSPCANSQGFDVLGVSIGLMNNTVDYTYQTNYFDLVNNPEPIFENEKRNFSQTKVSFIIENYFNDKLSATTDIEAGIGFDKESTFNYYFSETDEIKTYVSNEKLLSLKLVYGLNYYVYGDESSDFTFFINGGIGLRLM